MLTFFRRCSHQNASVPYLTNHLDTSSGGRIFRLHQGFGENFNFWIPKFPHQACVSYKVQVPSDWQITCCGFWRKASWKFLASVEKGKLRRSKSIEILLKHKIIPANLFSGFQKRRFGIFPAAMAWAQNLLGFCLFACASQTPFSWVWSGGLQASKSYVAQRFALLEATFFFVFSRFQKQRFGIFLFSAFFVGSKSNVSAVFWLRFRMVWAYIPFFLMGSNSDVSAFFRLRFRNGLGTKPAGVLPFRMRVPNTFFLSLAWWLAGFFFVFSRVQKQRFGSFLAAVSHGLGPISFSGWSIPETCHPSPNHCFDRPHPILLSPLLGVGGMGGSPSIYLEKKTFHHM